MSITSGRKSYIPRRSGFSVIEVIVAMAVLGVSTIAVFGALRTVSRAAYHTRMQTKAVLLAESLLAESRLSNDASYTTNQGTQGLYTWQVSIAPTSVEGLGKIMVTINWKEQQREQDYQLVSFMQMKTFGQ